MKSCGLILRYYSEIWLEGLSKTIKKSNKIAGLRVDTWNQDLQNNKEG
jgi:hypothetical protein